MQVFDSSGRPRLDGGSSFKDHIGWLPLLALSMGGGAPPGPGSPAATNPKLKDINFMVRSDNRASPQLQNALTNTADWSKATLDLFKDGDDQAWYLRLTLQQPSVASLQLSSLGSGLSVFEGTLEFAQSSIDYRDPDAKVGYFMPDGAVWDRDHQVCRLYDPDDPVSRPSE
jgi:type VI protein secretion system component Hcp